MLSVNHSFCQIKNIWWFNTFDSVKNKTHNSKFLQAGAFFLIRESKMVSKIFCKIKHIQGTHV